MKITLKDGSFKEYEGSMSVLDITKDISEGLARVATSARVNGEVVDLRHVVDEDCELEILTFDNEEGKGAFWHTTSHIMAQAIKRLYPDTKLAIGPSIENGFYYDVDRETPFAAEDLEKIEKEMKKIVKEALPIERFTKTREDAIAYFKEKDEPYKVELIEDLPEGEEISFYQQGEFVDLCAGPHLMTTKPVKAFKLTSLAGAYWRGSEKNKMLTRIYGISYPKKAQLDEYLTMLEEAKDELRAIRHTASHVLAQAVKRLYPETKLAIGPAIDDGFYYDFDREGGFTPDDLEKLEAEMKKIVKENLALKPFVLPRDEAIKFMQEKGEPYKVELIEDLPEGETISFYQQGDFVDLCAGPHILYTKGIKAFKLTSIAGAYWRGSEKNKMLTRIYGTAFAKKEDLEAYLTMMEEAKKRDHRKLGKELGLFMFAEEGPGFPFFLPKGMTLKNTLIDYWREIHLREGYQEVSTPVILSRKLWETSGHWDHYKENMYTTVIDDEDYAIKPMNCPGGMLVYKSQPRSYRDLPLRVGELGLVHRHEKSGQLHGLMRVRCFTQDDAHIFMTQDQITDEIKGVTRLINEVYSQFGFDYFVELSTRPEDSMGSDEDWEMATNGLRNALDEMGLKYIVNEGDGAFYGPKIDFHLRDSIGRTWQCGTIQLDFQLPQRFEAEYVAEDGTKKRPIMIHRVCFGSIERFIGILIEHFAGKFPVWLAPVQVKVIPVSEKSMEYAQGVYDQLKAAGIRTELDRKEEKVGYKIRQAQLEKVPFMLVLGEKEAAEGKITVRSRDKGDLGVADLSTFIADVKKMTETREK